ncbi:MAG: hypothetical protein ACOC7S_01685 [Planctomycetota bacterium]
MIRISMPAVLMALIFLSPLTGCGDDAEPDFAGRALEAGRRAERLQGKLSDSRNEAAGLRAELARTREQLTSARELSQGLRRELEAARAEGTAARGQADAAELDFAVAAAIGFASVICVLVTLHLLQRQVRARRVLTRLLRWIKERDFP